MISIRYGNKKIQNLLICLESLDLYNKDDTSRYLNKELNKVKDSHKYKRKWLNKKNIEQYCDPQQLITLNTINQIISRKDIQTKIVTILTNYSKTTISQNYKQEFSIADQYLNRFMYKYQNHYCYNSINNTHKYTIKSQEILRIGIVNLYLIYKSVSNESTHFLYQYLTTNKKVNKDKLNLFSF
uniref:Conserved hypothetical plastid protein n=1 Tax=Corallina ferreyrae TaxID=2547422 RepID=A0A482CFP4_9FLOR|nr:conserved hypothetical plastid protein [Corallina ferreyrae]QBL75603.1 conserved hypothetical plastid protein [Corallina ferreyrae]